MTTNRLIYLDIPIALFKASKFIIARLLVSSFYDGLEKDLIPQTKQPKQFQYRINTASGHSIETKNVLKYQKPFQNVFEKLLCVLQEALSAS